MELSNRQDRKMKTYFKIWIIALAILLFAAPVYSQIGVENQNYTFWATVLSENTFYPATGANLTLVRPNQSTFGTFEMTNYDVGQFYYVFQPDANGSWFAYAEFFNSSNHTVATGTDSFTVLSGTPLTEEDLNMTFEVWIIFFIGLALVVVARYIENLYLYFAGGVWFLAATATSVFVGNIGISESIFFGLLGTVIIFHGISEYLENKKKNARFGFE
jgi:hypothetical protein